MARTELAPRSVWQGKLYSMGWRSTEGGTLAVTDKASGEPLGEIGRAFGKDVSSAALIARESQHAWAALPGPHRGDIVRKASQLVTEHAEEIAAQIVRETGSILPKGRAEAALTARELLEAAALASQPTGFITASDSFWLLAPSARRSPPETPCC
jgi:benzaldehyde dehydrogenase (NAD)